MWFSKGKPVTEIPDDVLGFVYLITNTVDGRLYVGKKTFKFSKTSYKTVTLKNGTKKRKKIKKQVDSDWMDYYGSNKELLSDIEKHGPEFFIREILHFCSSKGEMSYLELKEQVLRDVLLTDAYYNGYIMARINHSHLKKLKKTEKSENKD